MKKYTQIVVMILTLTAFSSCLKDEIVLDPSKSNNVIEFKNIAPIASPEGSIHPLYSFSIDLAPSYDLNLVVNYSGPEPVAPQDIVVELTADSSIVNQYNEEQHTDYVPLTASQFTGVAQITIPQGQRSAIATFQLKPDQFDLALNSALGVRITGASSGVVSGNFGTSIYSVAVKNTYDGLYSYSGTTIRNSATGPDPALSGFNAEFPVRELVTTGANTVTIVPLWANATGIAGINGTIATIDPTTNLVTMSASGNATLKNTVGATNKYDPATKTFILAFDWGVTPNTRSVTMTLTYIGAR